MTVQHHRRAISLHLWSAIIGVLFLYLYIPQTSFAESAEEKSDSVEGLLIQNPGIELWREVRQRGMDTNGATQVKGVDSDILINPYGDLWARFRIEEIVTWGAIALVAMLVLILLFFIIRGRIRVKDGFSGDMVRRFNNFQIICHWFLASAFIFLGLTGLILLFGRTALIPLLGKEPFALLASLSKEGHDLVGLLFLASIVLMLIALIKRNLYEKGDLKWLATAGGVLGKSHPSIGFFNLGEKCLFWLVILLGLLISASGMVLLFPNFGQGRIIMELSHIIHAIAALSLIVVSFGHMYLGLVGVEGALQGMKNGYVDINWAQAHHDRWAEECQKKGQVISKTEYLGLNGNTERQ